VLLFEVVVSGLFFGVCSLFEVWDVAGGVAGFAGVAAFAAFGQRMYPSRAAAPPSPSHWYLVSAMVFVSDPILATFSRKY
jgi:hypothetical protein